MEPSFATIRAVTARQATAKTLTELGDPAVAGLTDDWGAWRAQFWFSDPGGSEEVIVSEAIAPGSSGPVPDKDPGPGSNPPGVARLQSMLVGLTAGTAQVFGGADLVDFRGWMDRHRWDDRAAALILVPVVVSGQPRGALVCWVPQVPSERWVDALLALADVVAGSVSCLLAAQDRASARADADERIERLNRRQDLVLTSAGEGICGLDRDGTIVFANPAAARLLGYDVADLNGRLLHELTHYSRLDGTPYPRSESPIYAALQDGAVHRVTGEVFWRRDGTSFPVEYVSTPMRDRSTITGAVVIFSDITERRQAEAAQLRLLRQAEAVEERFRGFLESVPDAIVIVSDQGHIVFVNHQTEVMFGYDRGDLLGQSLELLVPDWLRETHRMHRRDYGRAPRTRPMGSGLSIFARRRDGSEFPVEISLSPSDTGGERVVTSVIRDISERKRLFDAERRAHANLERQKDEFLTNVSHDLRTPLTGIKASIGVVLANEPPGIPEPLHRLFVNIDLAADRMASLVTDLLELTRLQAGRVPFRPQWCDLSEVARRSARAIEPLLPARNQRIEVDLPSEPCFTEADPDRLERALLNLLGNAQKYGKPNGTISFGLGVQAGEVIFSVTDDGPGIPEAEQQQIFSRFYRSEAEATQRKQGSGLGLPIARAMVELHRGRIWVESTPGHGATFSIALPLIASDETQMREDARA